MKQLDPKVIWIFFFGNFLRAIVIIIFFSGFISSIVEMIMYGDTIDAITGTWLVIFLLLTIVLIGLLYAWARLSYSNYKYELTEDGFRKESGVIYKKYTTIPYEKIQNIDIHRGILARILGLSDLQIQTAGASATYTSFSIGGGAAEGRLPGLSQEDAEQLRNELIQRSKTAK